MDTKNKNHLKLVITGINVWKKGGQRAPHKPRTGDTDTKKSKLVAHHVLGGFRKDILDKVSSVPSFVAEVANEILEAKWGLVFPILKKSRLMPCW